MKMSSAERQNQGDQLDLSSSEDKEGRTWKWLSLDTWFWELVLLTFSVLCFSAIVSLLLVYDKKPSPSLPHDLTLNTIVSILATASKSSLLCFIGAAIGQLKWLWFHEAHPRELYHLQAFDDASRGPMGALMILFQRQHPGHYLIFLGALTTIVALAFDPFIQQIIAYPVRSVNSTSSIATATQARFPIRPAVSIDDQFIDALNAGLWSQDFPINVTCPTGNCTWSPFLSTGWCSHCKDVTSSATLVGCEILPGFNDTLETNFTIPCNATLRHGAASNSPIRVQLSPSFYSVVLSDNVIWTVNTGGKVKNQTFLGVEDPVLVLAHAELEPRRSNSSDALLVNGQQVLSLTRVTECVLSMCARTYDIAVTKGDLSVSTSIPRYGRLFSYHYFYDPVDLKGEIANNSTDLCWTAGHEIPDTMTLVLTDTNPGLEPSIFKNVDEFAICPVQDIDLYVDRFLASTRNIEVYSSTGTTMSWSPSPSMKRVMTSGLDVVSKNIASSLTKYSLDFSNFTVNGAAKVPEVYVSVNWRFLSLPVAVLLLGFVFIVSTILISHKMKAPI